MSDFDHIAREHLRADAAYRRLDPHTAAWNSGHRAACDKLNELWAADPGHDPLDAARYIVAFITAERASMADDNGGEDGDNWEPDDAFRLACRIEEMAGRIVAALDRRPA